MSRRSQRGRHRFVFGRTYKRARRATMLRLRVTPNSLSVRYTPTGGRSRRISFSGRRITGSSRAGTRTSAAGGD